MNKTLNNLKGADIILNLKRIDIYEWETQSSSSCGSPAYFQFDYDTKAGHIMGDPDMAGVIKVLSVKKDRDGYLMRIKFKKDKKKYY